MQRTKFSVWQWHAHFNASAHAKYRTVFFFCFFFCHPLFVSFSFAAYLGKASFTDVFCFPISAPHLPHVRTSTFRRKYLPFFAVGFVV